MRITHDRLQLSTAVTIDDVIELDLLSTRFLDFKSTRQMSVHRIVGDEVGRPDLISFREYGTPSLYWFILKVNGIIDPYDLDVGSLLEVPSLLDFYEFVRSLE